MDSTEYCHSYDFDVTFQLCGEESTEVHAHRCILKARAPDLAEIVGENCIIPIEGVDSDVFQMILRFIYGGELPAKNSIKYNARAIVSASNRFGCTGLKLAAEAEVATAGITTENAADVILFADATNCAMLKEAAMDYFVENAQEVMVINGFVEVAKSPPIMKEMMSAMAVGSQKKFALLSNTKNKNYESMNVASLRQILDVYGLDVDGSKEMLISRLKGRDRKFVAENIEEEGKDPDEKSVDGNPPTL